MSESHRLERSLVGKRVLASGYPAKWGKLDPKFDFFLKIESYQKKVGLGLDGFFGLGAIMSKSTKQIDMLIDESGPTAICTNMTDFML